MKNLFFTLLFLLPVTGNADDLMVLWCEDSPSRSVIASADYTGKYFEAASFKDNSPTVFFTMEDPEGEEDFNRIRYESLSRSDSHFSFQVESKSQVLKVDGVSGTFKGREKTNYGYRQDFNGVVSFTSNGKTKTYEMDCGIGMHLKD